jgi:hypothetical protein
MLPLLKMKKADGKVIFGPFSLLNSIDYPFLHFLQFKRHSTRKFKDISEQNLCPLENYGVFNQGKWSYER